MAELTDGLAAVAMAPRVESVRDVFSAQGFQTAMRVAVGCGSPLQGSADISGRDLRLLCMQSFRPLRANVSVQIVIVQPAFVIPGHR